VGVARLALSVTANGVATLSAILRECAPRGLIEIKVERISR
jgi:hypothetical protein